MRPVLVLWAYFVNCLISKVEDVLPNFCHCSTDTFLLLKKFTLLLFQFKSLDLFGRIFLGVITEIWASTPLNIRLRGSEKLF